MNYKFACGCKFKQLDTVVKDCDGLPPLEIDYYNLPECPEVWSMLGTGKTKGIFQLEKSLGRHWCKELQPENIHHLAALSAILRPSCLESIINDKNLTQHYCDNKNDRQEKIPIHPALEKVLEDTQQVIIYQESILSIAKEIAGFNGVEADTLRRGIGHKDAKVVFEMEKKFIDGCARVGEVNEEDAKMIFNIIKSSCRYTFNASITENCMVETLNGQKSIKDVKIGDIVKTPNGESKVVNWYDHGKQLVYGVTSTISESYIEATLEHKFLCEDSIVRKLEDILDKKYKVVTKFGLERLIISDYLDFRQTYDIEIDSEDHIFWGNNIATSNSHAYAYGTIGYYTSFVKQHFPLHFYAAYIAHAKDKQDPKEEVKELIDDARNFGIDVIPPHITSLKNNPSGDVTIEDQKILFGIVDIKGIAKKKIEKMYASIIEKEKVIGKDIKNWSWNDFLFNIDAGSTVVNNLILVGATPGGIPRKQKAYEYSIFQNLTSRELEWVAQNYSNHETLGDALNKYSTIERKEGGPANVKRKAYIEDSAKLLKESPYSTKDHPDWIVANERELIGIPITYSSTENKMVNTGMTCSDFLHGKRGKINILVEISSFKEYTIKKGANAGLLMCVLELKDSTDSITGIMFHEDYKNNQEYLFDGNVVVVSGFKSKKDKNCLIINKVLQV